MSIVAQKITYIHPDNQVLFKGIDLTINKGQKVALVGNNGSGKSTFLRILAGTLQAQEGEIIYPTPPYYVPQHFGQYDNLTVAQALRIDGKLEALRAITEGDASLSNFNTLADDFVTAGIDMFLNGGVFGFSKTRKSTLHTTKQRHIYIQTESCYVSAFFILDAN